MDIDIDFPTTFDPKRLMKQAIPASMVKNGQLVKHPCGHYFQTIPRDEVTKLSAIPYEEAEVMGYFKIDFLHLSLLDHFTSKDEIRRLMNIPPDWSLLLHTSNVHKLFQIHKHADLLKEIKPTSVQQLADCIALIRPGKKHLLESYKEDPDRTRVQLYANNTDGYYFKRSHAISYALTIVLQLHLIAQGTI